MGMRDFYQQDAGRGIEVTCGVVLLLFSGLSGFVAVFGLANALRYPRALVGTAIFGLLSWGLLHLALRLLRGRGRTGSVLLPPIMLMTGAVIFVIGGLLLIYVGITERNVQILCGGLGILPAAYFSWKFALEGRKQS